MPKSSASAATGSRSSRNPSPRSVPAGHIPSVDEAKKRLAHLQEHGATFFAFTFRDLFPPDEEVVRTTDWSAFEPCPAV